MDGALRDGLVDGDDEFQDIAIALVRTAEIDRRLRNRLRRILPFLIDRDVDVLADGLEGGLRRRHGSAAGGIRHRSDRLPDILDTRLGLGIIKPQGIFSFL